jgi:hypothetical protein
MFVNAIESVSKYTAGIHTIERTFGKSNVRPGAATMFFVNDQGCAITCKHVADLIPFAQDLLNRFNDYKGKKELLVKGGSSNKKVKELAKQNGFTENTLCELFVQFQSTGTFDSITYHLHPKYDLAIIQFNNMQNANRPFARFLSDGATIKQGKFLCRLGFPFPEFTNYEYITGTDSIAWTTAGINATPCFPIDGMVTRFLADSEGVWGIELSTPGLKGQSGGPLFDGHGVVYGMQSATNHLHLGFDVKNKEVVSNGEKIKVTNQPFLHVGHCIHVDIIKKFLTEKEIQFHLST